MFFTHGHLDHAGGITKLSERLGVAIEEAAKMIIFFFEELDKHSVKPGFADWRSFTPPRWLMDGDVVNFWR